MQSHGYLARLLPPVKWDTEEIKAREDVEKGIADEDERSMIIAELEAANWPHDLAVKMTRESHPMTHGER